MTIYTERCSYCNNILDDFDRCPLCDKGEAPSMLASLPPRLPGEVRIFDVSFSLTYSAKSSFIDLGLHYIYRSLDEMLGDEPYVYIYNGGRSSQDEVQAFIRLATDIDDAPNQDIRHHLDGQTLEFVVVFSGFQYEGENVEYGSYLDDASIISLKKKPASFGYNAGEQCLLVRLRHSNSPDIDNLVYEILQLPTMRDDQEAIQEKIRQWQVYLDVLEKSIRKKQYHVDYLALRGPEDDKVVFHLDASNGKIPWQLIEDSLDWPLIFEASPSAANDDREPSTQWRPPPIGKDIGKVVDYSEKKNTITIKLENIAIYENLPPVGRLFYDARGHKFAIKRMSKGMQRLKDRRHLLNPALPDFLFDGRYATPVKDRVRLTRGQVLVDEIFKNPSQLRAVEGALSAPDLFLVQGPPGTGKTSIIAEICYQFARQGKRILISSQANLAVDNALARIVKHKDVRVIRLGASERVEEEGRDFIEENVVRTWLGDTRRLLANKLGKEIEQLESIKQKLTAVEEMIDVIKDGLSTANRIGNWEDEQEALEYSLGAVENLFVVKEDALWVVLRENWSWLPQTLKDAIYDYLIPPAKILNIIKVDHLTDIPVQVCDFFARWTTKRDAQRLDALLELQVLQIKCQAISQLVEELKAAREKSLQNHNADFGIQKRIARVVNRELQPTIDTWRVELQSAEQRKAEILAKLDFGELYTDSQTISGITANWAELQGWENETKKKIVGAIKYFRQQHKWYEECSRRLEGIKRKIEDAKNQLQPLEVKLAHYRTVSDLPSVSISQDSLDLLEKERDALVEALDRIAFIASHKEFVSKWLTRLENLTEKDVDDLHQIYIDNVNVVGATCNMTGQRRFMEKYAEFDCVIVDEVSRAVPPEIVLPALKGKKLILVGDHKQLPPLIGEDDINEVLETLTLDMSKRGQFQRSHFEKLFGEVAPSLKETLTIQYRMHPQIMEAVNQFYDDKLTCGIPDPDNKRAHGLEYLDEPFQSNHLVWIDVPLKPEFFEISVGTSFANHIEQRLAINLYERMSKIWRERLEKEYSKNPLQMGIISFYAAQVYQIRNRVDKIYWREDAPTHLRIGTVDRFQGMEQEVIVASLVRNNNKHNIGFAKRPERINVAFSRAQKLLVIIGCSKLFCDPKASSASRYYRAVYDLAKQNNAVIHISNAPAWLVK